jgi:hypothetical protein
MFHQPEVGVVLYLGGVMFWVSVLCIAENVVIDAFGGYTLKSFFSVNRIIMSSFPKMDDRNEYFPLWVLIFKKLDMPRANCIDQVLDTFLNFFWIRTALVQTPGDKTGNRRLGDATGVNRTASGPNL